MGHVDVTFSSVFVIVNLQTWVLLFDFLGIGIPTPPPSPSLTLSPFLSSSAADIVEPSHTRPASTASDVVFSLSADGSVRISPPAPSEE